MIPLQQLTHFGETTCNHVIHGLLVGLGQGLFQPGDFYSGSEPAFSAIGLHGAGNHFHEGCLTGAVASQQTDLGAFLQGEIHFIQKNVSTKIKRDFIEAY